MRDPMFSRFGTVPACNGRTDRRTDRDDSIYRVSIASRGKKHVCVYFAYSLYSVIKTDELVKVAQK